MRAFGFRRGADITFLSAFPAEKETLFSPLTYLQVIDQTPVPPAP